jgi:molybdenum cofactor biosynthesis enzyme MoaA
MSESDGTMPPVCYLDGWYDWELDNYFPFRWMGREATLALPLPVLRGGRFLTMPIFSPFGSDTQVFSISAGGSAPMSLPLRPGWHIYDVALAAIGVSPDIDCGAELRLAVNPVSPQDLHPGDGRELGAAVGALEVHDDRRRHELVRAFTEGPAPSADASGAPGKGPARTAAEVTVTPGDGAGWHQTEWDDEGPFHWMSGEADIPVPEAAAAKRFCLVAVYSNYNNLAQELTVLEGDRVLAKLSLLRRWYRYSVALPVRRGTGPRALRFRLNRLIPTASHPDDLRDLGARVGTLTFHDDAESHALVTARHQNDMLRQRELRDGATVLSSSPSNLGIDLFGKCNIKPACVYCPWDRMKALEGENTNAVVDDTTLESYGPVFRGAHSLVNCSFGEPLLHPRLEQVLELVARHRQTIELSTNGQAFTARTVRALAGAPVFLYVSLDAATASTYSHLRNDRWHEIIAGLLALRQARLEAGGWPRVNIVFIPMRANRGDLESCFKLCRLVDANALVLRPLLVEDSAVNVERGGYRFVYDEEHLGEEGLADLVTDCRRFAERYRVRVMTQFDFGKVDFGGLTAAHDDLDQR